MERLVELFEATMSEDPTGDLGFHQLEGLCGQHGMDLGATFCTIAMALEKKHLTPSVVAYSKALIAIDKRLSEKGSRPSLLRQAQWEKCVVLQQMGKMCVMHERPDDAIEHVKKSCEIPKGPPAEKLLGIMDFTSTPNHFLSTGHKLLARAYALKAKEGQCDPSLVEKHMKLSQAVLTMKDDTTENRNGTPWLSLPEKRHFEYSFSSDENRVEVYIQAGVSSKDVVRLSQPDERTLDVRWQKDGIEHWFHLCPMEVTVMEDTSFRLNKKGKLTVTLYFTSKRLVRSALVTRDKCLHHAPVIHAPPPEEWPEVEAPKPTAEAIKTPQKLTKIASTEAKSGMPNLAAEMTQQKVTNIAEASTAAKCRSAPKPAAEATQTPQKLTKVAGSSTEAKSVGMPKHRPHGPTVAALPWDDPTIPPKSTPAEERSEERTHRVVSVEHVEPAGKSMPSGDSVGKCDETVKPVVNCTDIGEPIGKVVSATPVGKGAETVAPTGKLVSQPSAKHTETVELVPQGTETEEHEVGPITEECASRGASLERLSGPVNLEPVLRDTTSEVTREGDTLIVRLDADPDVNLDLKSDVLRVCRRGVVREIPLGCSVDVTRCKAKKRSGMIEVRLVAI